MDNKYEMDINDEIVEVKTIDFESLRRFLNSLGFAKLYYVKDGKTICLKRDNFIYGMIKIKYENTDITINEGGE